MPRDAAEIPGKCSKYLYRIVVVDDDAGDGISKELQDPADDHAVTDGDSEGTDDRDQTDDSAEF